MQKKKYYSYIDIFAWCGWLSLWFYNSKKWNGLFAIEKSEDAFFGIIKDDNSQSFIKARSLINNDSKLISLKDYYNIKSIDINNLRDKKLNTKLNFFIKIQKTENKKKEFNILGIYYYLSNNNNFKKLYFN